MPVYVCLCPESVHGLPVVHKVCSIPGISHSLLALCRCYFSQLQSAFCSLFVNLKQLRTRSDWDVYVQEYRNWVYLDPERTGIQTTFKKRWEFFVAWEGKYWKTKSVMIALWFSLRSRSIRWWVYQSGLHGSLALGEHPILTTSLLFPSAVSVALIPSKASSKNEEMLWPIIKTMTAPTES